jgi:hypothetical protein
MKHLVRTFALSFVATGLASAQTTWVVDDDPGPGVDFTDLPPAVAAAGIWDTIVVRDGLYSSTVVDRGVRIVGEGASASWILWDLTVRDVPAGQLVVIAGLRISDDLDVERCDGLVVLEDVRADDVDVDASFDVRMHRVTAWNPGLGDANRFVGSRVEAVDCLFQGHTGYDGDCDQGDDGELGLETVASFVHLAASAARGGAGGYCNESVLGCCPGTASTGGPGLEAFDSQLVLTGAGFGHGVFGGDGGRTWRIWQSAECPCGDRGPGLSADGAPANLPSLRTSDVTISGDPAQSIGASVSVTAATGDPVMLLGGPVRAGQPLLVTIHGAPGERVQLEFGRNAVQRPVVGSPIDQLTSAERRAGLGNVPPGGALQTALSVPAQWPTGIVFFMQARVTDPTTGATRMSNSVPFLVR